MLALSSSPVQAVCTVQLTRQAVHAQAGSPVWRSQLSFSSRCYFSSFELKDHVADIGYVDQYMDQCMDQCMCMSQYMYMDHYMFMDHFMCINQCKDQVGDIGYMDQHMCMGQYMYMDHYMCMDQCKDQVGDIGYVVAVMGGSREVAAS